MDVEKMQKMSCTCIKESVTNWGSMEVRTVPGVMYQVRCGKDKFDYNIDYQLNLFINCGETRIHNHRHSFDTLCLEGGYIEKLWKIIDDQDGVQSYQFERIPPNHAMGPPNLVPGQLRPVVTRRHYPNNLLDVGIGDFHSIIPYSDSGERVLTFLAKRAYPDLDIKTYILSSTPDIEAPKDVMRPSTEEEREIIYEKLVQVNERTK